MNKYMLIDDDDFFLILNKDILTLTNPDTGIIQFNSAISALEWMKKTIQDHEKEWPENILLDIRMPFMNGFDFLEKLKEFPLSHIRNIKVFMMTSSLDERDYIKAQHYPFVYSYFTKPLTIEMIEEIESMELKEWNEGTGS
ncbi:MAG TPA: response regulator [Chitinophagaceae bacterium]|jgi:two-component system chemotaxis response regulator CheY|nr:response regulator [Chitinophagaceae bacterium]